MANLATDPNFKSPYATGALSSLDGNALVQLRSALKNLGYYQGPVDTSPLDFGTAAALGQFQYTFGYGDPSAQINPDQWYGLLYANDQVTNGAKRGSLDPTVAASLRAAKQYNPNLGVIDPTAIEQEIQARKLPTSYPMLEDPALVAQFELAKKNTNDAYGQALAALDFRQGQEGADYTQRQGALAQQYDNMREKLPGSYAGRGLLNSGIYHQGLVNYAQQRQTATSDLDYQHQQALDQFGFQRQQAEISRDNSLASIEQQRKAQRASVAAQLKAIQ